MSSILPPEEHGYAQVAQESITTWAEAVGLADLSPDICRLLSSDVTYRLRQVLHSAAQHLHACKRYRLTPDDFNKALSWMDVPPVLGHSGCLDSIDWLYIPEVGVHVVSDPPLNLASTALPGDIYHQPGNPCVKGEWSYISNHIPVKGESGGEGSLAPLPLSSQLTKYYTTLVSAIFGHSNTIFQRLHDDLRQNPNVSPLVGAVVSGCLRGAQLARQNPCILRRVLLVIRAMLANEHVHVGHAKYVRDIMSLIVFCVVTERKLSNDTHPIRSLATNTMLKVLGEWSEGHAAWEVAVSSLGAVIASTSRPWSQHAGALTALLALGPAAQVSLLPYYTSYYNRLEGALPSHTSPTVAFAPSSLYITTREAIDAKAAQGVLMAVLVKIAASYVRDLPDNVELTGLRKENHRKNESTCSDQDPSNSNSTTTNTSTTTAGSAGGSSEYKTSFKKEKKDMSYGSPGLDSSKTDPDDLDVVFSKLREVYTMGESWFGSAFVLQVPSVYLCLHKNQMPSFMESHIYKEMQTTGVALLRDMLNREQSDAANRSNRNGSNEPCVKKRKLSDSVSAQPPSYDLGSDFTGLDFESLISDVPIRPYKKLPEDVFAFYKRILPRRRQVVSMNIQGCNVWDPSSLKRPKGLMPDVIEHVNKPLLVKYYKSKSNVNKMPHCKFTRPLYPKIKPGFLLQHSIL